jgi:DNA-binding transcriptional LysR family regulator
LVIPETFSCSTIESVIGLVASGIGWTILTPVCVRKYLHLVPALRLQPVPGQAFSRKIHLATRKTELDPHAERAAQICRTVLQKIYAPSLHRLAPWMKTAFVAK